MNQDQNLKINLPNSVDELIQLGDAIVKKHVEDGPQSNLSAAKIAKINFTLAQARDKYREVERYRSMLNESVDELKRLLGSGSKKSSFKQVLKATMEELAVSVEDDEVVTGNPVFKYILIESEEKENLEN